MTRSFLVCWVRYSFFLYIFFNLELAFWMTERAMVSKDKVWSNVARWYLTEYVDSIMVPLQEILREGFDLILCLEPKRIDSNVKNRNCKNQYISCFWLEKKFQKNPTNFGCLGLVLCMSVAFRFFSLDFKKIARLFYFYMQD